uniref:Amine oxidase domain-containing protein n=1 Tax=Acrobeloides nanus TaxID=290746 RepID=A0A914E6M2_9BILA
MKKLLNSITFSKIVYIRKFTQNSKEFKKKYDVIIIGGGHNGLTAAAYLSKAGKKVCVLERRHVLGGAAVTEEIVPGFKFSRASYLLGLFRPLVMQELNLKEHGLKYHAQDPFSFTPVRNSNKSLLLGGDMKENLKEIAKFSKKDAEAFPKYEDYMMSIGKTIEGIFDQEPLNWDPNRSKMQNLKKFYEFYKSMKHVRIDDAKALQEVMFTSVGKVLDKWFENDVIKGTLSYDGVIGVPYGPYNDGTGYVLLHHVIGSVSETPGVWGIVYGGMGSVSNAIASAAKSFGAELFTESEVSEILVENGHSRGVKLSSGKEILADTVLSNATPKITFLDLLSPIHLNADFLKQVNTTDFTSTPVTKINVALKELPNFTCRPNIGNNPMPHHQANIHINCESMEVIQQAYEDFKGGNFSKRTLIELVLPSSVDRTIVPDEKSHVALIFTQYTPYELKNGKWDQEMKDTYAKHVFSEIDVHAPNFSKSVIGYEVLPPPELEKVFNMSGGNIFHGVMSPHQLYWLRPLKGYSNYQTPIKGLYLCGCGTHPGGGVTGGPGRLSALKVLEDTK